MSGDFKHRCNDCPIAVKVACKYVFGKFYGVKSSGGDGCNHPPFAEESAAALRRNLGFDAEGRIPGDDEF